jgi:hypothetical protein
VLLVVIIVIFFRSRTGIAFLEIIMVLVQAFDGVVGAIEHDFSKTYGPFIFAAVTGALVVSLLRETKAV